MMQSFEMVAKTLKGLEEVLAQELRELGATQVEPGLRMVSFHGDLEMLYKANFCCRTALRILKPFYKFFASSPEELYEIAKEFDWSTILGPDKTFAVDTVSNSEEFSHSRYATYRVKDAINDWFSDRYGDKRPRVSTVDPDILINLHIAGDRVTLSLDSSGESLHKRGYRVVQTEAPINEVLAAGIILLTGWRGETPFVDPMCGSGTFLVEAALIAANIYPGIFRSNFAFEKWKDFNPELFDAIYNDDSKERDITVPILGADISPKAIAATERNLKSARVAKWVNVEVKSIKDWQTAPANGVLVTNPPYGERLNPENLSELYSTIGHTLKHIFTGYHAWIISYHAEHFAKIGLAPSQKIELMNGSLDCRLEEYIIFQGEKKAFRKSGGDIKAHVAKDAQNGHSRGARHQSDREWAQNARRSGLGADNLRDGNERRPNRRERETTPGERFRRAFDNHEYASGSRRRDKSPRSEYPFKKNGPKKAVAPSSPRPEKPGDMPLVGRQPSLPPQEGPLMRERRSGWKKRPDWMGNPDANNSNPGKSDNKSNNS